MRTIIIIALLFSIVKTSSAQSIDNKVIASSGKALTHASASIEGTLGEPFVKVLMNNGYTISQGFHQPTITIVPVKISEDGELVEIEYATEAEFEKAAVEVAAAVEIYPNPTADFVNIRIDGDHPGKGRILMYNMQGKLVNDTRFEGGFVSVEFTGEAPGNYILHLIDDSGVLSGTYKIVKSN